MQTKEQIAAKRKTFREANREKIAAYKNAYYVKNREKMVAYYKARYAANREKITAQKKVYYAANRDKVATYEKARYVAHREKVVARVKAYRKANREKMLAYDKARYKLNPNERLAGLHNRRAQKLGVSIGDIKAILAWIKGWKTESPVACHYCKAVSPGTEMQIDHVIPLSKGGPHDLSNLVVCCPFCNNSKNNKLPAEWLAKTG